MTLHTPVPRELVDEAAQTLANAGVESAEHDAAELLAHTLGVDRAALLAIGTVTTEQAARFRAQVANRAARVPLQHLTGVVGFRYLELAVGPGAFVPRPETETVVGWAVAAVRRDPPADRPVVAVDLCAGPGPIALSLAHELPAATVHAVELDPAAFTWLERNAHGRARAGDPPVALHCADAATALPELDGGVDLVVSNPPYLPLGSAPLLPPEVSRHDPPLALWGGSDGLAVIRAVIATARRLLRPGGILVLEHADEHGTSVPGLLRADPAWRDVADHRDLTGRDRFATASRSTGRAGSR